MAVITRSLNIEFCRGTGSDNQDHAGTRTAYELTAMLIYVSSQVHVRVIWWVEVCLSRSLVKDHIDTVWNAKNARKKSLTVGN